MRVQEHYKCIQSFVYQTSISSNFSVQLNHHARAREVYLEVHFKYRLGQLQQHWDNYLSIFLLLALRRATIPSFAIASREYGSIPCKPDKELKALQ